MPECEAAHFWVGQKAEPHIFLGAPWAEKVFEGSSSEGLHSPAGVLVSVWFYWFFNRPLWEWRKSRGRGVRRMGLVYSAGRQHPLEFQDFKAEWVTFLSPMLNISAGIGGFLLLFVCWAFGRPQWDCSSLLVVERGLSRGPGECYGVSERLAQLPPSPLGWIAGDSTMSVTKTVSSNASETF